MAKFNATSESTTKIVNRAGGEAHKQTPKLEFISFLLTSFVKDQYYQKETEVKGRITSLLEQVDPLFAAKAAVYARNEFGMRSISHMVAGELADKASGTTWGKAFYSKVVHRPDDITEIIAYRLSMKAELTHAMRKGLASSFGQFDGYQLAKYRGEGKDVNLVDAVRLLHPQTTDKNAEALALLIKGELASKGTWESELSEAGKTSSEDKAAKKAEAWTTLVKERKIGYFALLRNLRNIIEQAPEVTKDAVAMLTDEKLIRKSLVLPFRFYSAYAEIMKLHGAESRLVLSGLSKAIDLSFDNVPKFDGDTLVVVDHSGSMGAGVGSKSNIGALFGIALAKSNNADFMHFGNDAKYWNIDLDTPTLKQLETFDTLNGGYYDGGRGGSYVGHGTDFKSIFQAAAKAYDRIVIFSDMQAWVGYYTPKTAVASYKTRTGANPHIYTFDLAGHGDMQFPEQNVYALAGFSEKAFDIMKLLEQDKQALVNRIEQVQL